MTTMYFLNGFEFNPKPQSQPKWERQPTWRERVNAGEVTWDDYVRYRLARLETEDMEYVGYDEVIHTCTMPMTLKVVAPKNQIQGFFTIE